MTSPSRRVIANVHIYQTDRYYVAPVVRESTGLWVEAQPIFMAQVEDADGLVRAMSAAHHAVQRDTAIPGWDGQGGQVWASARHFWSIRWHDDSTVTVMPYHRADVSVGGEKSVSASKDTWVASRALSKNLSAPTDVIIAQAILEMAKSAG